MPSTQLNVLYYNTISGYMFRPNTRSSRATRTHKIKTKTTSFILRHNETSILVLHYTYHKFKTCFRIFKYFKKFKSKQLF